jgi:hypothetical protein
MFHGVIEANSSTRATESRLVNESDDADRFLTGAARHGCQHCCAQVAGGIRAGLCRRPLQPINTQHRNPRCADCEAAVSGLGGSCQSPVHGASVTSRPDATFSTKNEFRFLQFSQRREPNTVLDLAGCNVRALCISSNLHLHSTSSFPKRGSELALTCRRVFQI